MTDTANGGPANTPADDARKPEPGEPATPQEAHDETAANVRALREGDDLPPPDA